MINHYYKKSFEKKLRDAFTKTFGQIYEQYSKSEKIGYWVVVAAGFLVIVYTWVVELGIF